MRNGRTVGTAVAGERFPVIRKCLLDGTGAEDGTIRFGDNDRSVLPCMHHVAARSEGSEADELDGRLWNIMDQGAEAGGTDMSGMDGCSVGAGDRDEIKKLDGLEKIGEGVSD